MLASEPPRPTILSAAAIGSLLVALDDLGIAHVGRLGVVPGLPERPALAEQVPALVETDLDRLEPAVLALVQAPAGTAFIELLLLGNELLDAIVDLFVFHLAS
jgi:hypothetical protein